LNPESSPTALRAAMPQLWTSSSSFANAAPGSADPAPANAAAAAFARMAAAVAPQTADGAARSAATAAWQQHLETPYAALRGRGGGADEGEPYFKKVRPASAPHVDAPAFAAAPAPTAAAALAAAAPQTPVVADGAARSAAHAAWLQHREAQYAALRSAAGGAAAESPYFKKVETPGTYARTLRPPPSPSPPTPPGTLPGLEPILASPEAQARAALALSSAVVRHGRASPPARARAEPRLQGDCQWRCSPLAEVDSPLEVFEASIADLPTPRARACPDASTPWSFGEMGEPDV